LISVEYISLACGAGMPQDYFNLQKRPRKQAVYGFSMLYRLA